MGLFSAHTEEAVVVLFSAHTEEAGSLITLAKVLLISNNQVINHLSVRVCY